MSDASMNDAGMSALNTAVANALGTPVDRSDGLAKVTGAARYAADIPLAAPLHAAIVPAAIAAGRVTRVDANAATDMPGVRHVFHPGKAPTLAESAPDYDLYSGGYYVESLMPLQDSEVFYHGQIVAVVLADTVEQAREAAHAIDVSYREAGAEHDLPEPVFPAPEGAILPEYFYNEHAQSERGTPRENWESARHRVEAEYTTPLEYHAAMELHATLVSWDGGMLTINQPSQWVAGTQRAVAGSLGIPEDQVRIKSPFVGGAFGGKGVPRPHIALFAAIAREVGRPVKLVHDREGVFLRCGVRPATRQRLRVSAERNGRITAIVQDTVSNSSAFDVFAETAGYPGRYLYSNPDHAVTHRVVQTNIHTPMPMRAPGEGPGTFGLECALDELAHEIGMDPVEFRLRNLGERDLNEDLPLSANHMSECLRQGRDVFGWNRRGQRPGTTRRADGTLVGYGMASAAYPVFHTPSKASAILRADGTATIRCATHEIGTGTYTVLAQIAAAHLGIDPSAVMVEVGDTVYPRGPASVGALTVCSVAPAISDAITAAVAKLGDARPADFVSALRASGRQQVEATVEAVISPAMETHSLKTFGAQFAEVHVNPDTCEIRVASMAGAFDFGTVINAKTAESQLKGGMIFGIGMALLEGGAIDHHSGRTLVHSLAEYLVPVNLDVPEIDIVMIDKPDPMMNGIGAKGCGEIGNSGAAAAIGNAVFNATGVRLRDLPLRLEHLMAANV